MSRTRISTSFILKPFGARIVIPLTPEMLVFMHIIGKISEGSLISLNMKGISALNGRPRTLSKLMLMVANTNTDANSRMAGKNKNTIPLTIRFMLVESETIARNLTALTTTQRMIEDSHWINTSNSFPRIEAPLNHKPKSISLCSLIYCLTCQAGLVKLS